MRLINFRQGAIIIFLFAPFLFGQLRVPISSEQSNLINFNQKSHEIASSCSVQDSQLTKFRMRKSPAIAVLLSAVIPGAGQFYNESYWKIPIIAGLTGYFGYEYFNNDKSFRDYRDRYNASVTPENQFGDPNLKTLREFYRNQRDDFVWYFIITYVVNLVDAYVDAHLFDFDVKEEKFTQFGFRDRIYRLKLGLKF